jgi:hypothetical protein
VIETLVFWRYPKLCEELFRADRGNWNVVYFLRVGSTVSEVSRDVAWILTDNRNLKARAEDCKVTLTDAGKGFLEEGER